VSGAKRNIAKTKRSGKKKIAKRTAKSSSVGGPSAAPRLEEPFSFLRGVQSSIGFLEEARTLLVKNEHQLTKEHFIAWSGLDHAIFDLRTIEKDTLRSLDAHIAPTSASGGSSFIHTDAKVKFTI
jgi:hypothetical protein